MFAERTSSQQIGRSSHNKSVRALKTYQTIMSNFNINKSRDVKDKNEISKKKRSQLLKFNVHKGNLMNRTFKSSNLENEPVMSQSQKDLH